MSTPAKMMPSRAVEIVGAANFTDDPREVAAYAVDGVRPSAAARPGGAGEVAELVKLAAVESLAVIPTGARTKLGIGMPPARYDLAIDMTRLDRVISYDPGDLTLSVEAGIPLAKLAATLAEHKQFLPLAVPFYERATIGGTLASGVDSPLRQMYGTARDFVLGMEFVTGDGALAKSGGRVVKNVSGYDLHKLFLGSIGSLGIITRINFKTFPLPRTSATFLAAFRWAHGASRFDQLIQQSVLRPQAVEIIDPAAAGILNSARSESDAVSCLSGEQSWFVAVKIIGHESVIDRCRSELEQFARAAHRDSLHSFEKIPDAESERLWAAIREFPAAAQRVAPDAVIFKFSLLPMDSTGHFEGTYHMARHRSATVARIFRGAGVCYAAFFNTDATKLLDLCTEIFATAATRWIAPVSIPYCPPELKRQLNIWGAPSEDFPLMQRVKQAFDPHRVFAPGRFVGGL